ncbi:hypothetical protein [Streptomyces sp. CBMA123]|uniref:hypothetical protein n=1 Tax=Streptomyces sp. CBMA123 TaxID=1896313 RepID=UPI001661EF01|nr:hypothetical protein [Streptomyces sp. CBMA123]
MRNNRALEAFTGAVACRLRGTWESALEDVSTSAALTEMYERLWDLGITQWAMLEFANDRLGMLPDAQGRELVVLPRPFRAGCHLIAPLVPAGTEPGAVKDLTPFGLSVSTSPARAAETVRRRLLPRLDYALLMAEERGACPGAPSDDGRRRVHAATARTSVPAGTPPAVVYSAGPLRPATPLAGRGRVPAP